MADNFEFYQKENGETRVKFSGDIDAEAVHASECVKNPSRCFEKSPFESPSNQLSSLGLFRSKPNVAIFNNGFFYEKIPSNISLSHKSIPSYHYETYERSGSIKVVPPESDVYFSKNTSETYIISSNVVEKKINGKGDYFGPVYNFKFNFQNITHNEKYKKKLCPGDYYKWEKNNLPTSNDYMKDLSEAIGSEKMKNYTMW